MERILCNNILKQMYWQIISIELNCRKINKENNKHKMEWLKYSTKIFLSLIAQ